MNILSNVMENVKRNLIDCYRKYNLSDLFRSNCLNTFDNYLSLIKTIDYTSTNFSVDLYKAFLEEMDNSFFNSDYRKRYCDVICFNEKSIITFYGEVIFSRRRYFDKFSNKEYYFVDQTLMMNKYSRFDPFVCAKICEVASIDSYAKAGRTVSEMIGNRLKFDDDSNKFLINRATARNIVHRFNIPDIPYKSRKDVSMLYVMLDEKFVHSQFNDGKDHMVKASVIFEDIIDEYKTHTTGKPRLRLTGKKVHASIDNDLKDQVLDYIYYTYDTDKISEIIFMGDCASWITNFPKGFKYHKDLKITFAIDGFHYSQAIQHILTNKYAEDFTDTFLSVIKNNDKKAFINLCELIITYEPHRSDTIIEKQNYILNNWQYIQNYYHKIFVNCSMEAHISHCFADIFTSRPRAYSKKGLRQLLKLRLLKVNDEDIQKIYFEVLKNKTASPYKLDTSYCNIPVSTPYSIMQLYTTINNTT